MLGLIFNLDINVYANKWVDEKEKQTFIDNFTSVVQEGLEKMGVPDWTVDNVTVISLEEEFDEEDIKMINKNFRIYIDVDEIRIIGEDGYPYITIADPDNNNPGAMKVAEEILKNIDLKEMI